MTVWKKRSAVALGHMFDFYDLAVYGAIAAYVSASFFPQKVFGEQAFYLVWMTFALRFLARPVGGLVISSYADRYGRKPVLIFTSALTGMATLIMACLPTYEQIGVLAPCLFFIMQCMQAFAVGAEVPTASAYLLEEAKQNEQARVGALLGGTPFLAVLVSLLIVAGLESSLTTEQMQHFGWRIPLLLGVINIFISYQFKKQLIESDTFTRSRQFGIQWLAAFKVFLVMAPTSVIFYTNALSSKLILTQITSSPEVLFYAPLCMNAAYFIMCGVLAYCIDRLTSCHKVLTYLYAFLIVFAVPIYMLQDMDNLYTLIVSQIFVVILTSLSLLACTPSYFRYLGQNNKIATIALGHNVSAVLFGGFTPLLVGYLSQYGQSYVGLFISITSLCYFLAMIIHKKYTYREAII